MSYRLRLEGGVRLCKVQALRLIFRALRLEGGDRFFKFRALESIFRVLRMEGGDRISKFRALKVMFLVAIAIAQKTSDFLEKSEVWRVGAIAKFVSRVLRSMF